MSVQAMSWALDHRQTGTLPAEARLVLVSLADYADPTGRHAWPAAGTLAARLGITVRSVRRSIALLEDLGLIRLDDQRIVEHLRADRRPKVWRLALDGIQVRLEWDLEGSGPAGTVVELGAEPYDRDRHGVTNLSPREPVDNPSRGDAHDPHGVTPASPKPNTQTITPTHLGLLGDPAARETHKLDQGDARTAVADLEPLWDAALPATEPGAWIRDAVIDTIGEAAHLDVDVDAYHAAMTAQRDELDRVTPKTLGKPQRRDGARVRRLGLTDRNCPACGQPVYRSHTCRASGLAPATTTAVDVREALAAARAAAPVSLFDEPQLELVEAPRGECEWCGRAANLVDGVCPRCLVEVARMGPHDHPITDER